ncbi:hypothetical protein PtB15_14B58 [Puccinia triticina]|nr:hypothetical protein PtB15_14B58 [Puccinia triticina]
MAPQPLHGRPAPNSPSAFAASSSTPSMGTGHRKKAILKPVYSHHRLLFAFAARPKLPAINSIPEHALPTSLELIQSKQDLSALLNILIGAIYPICFAAPLSCLLTALVSSAAYSKALLICSTPSTPLPPTSLPSALSLPKINTIISTNKIAESLASPIQTLPPPPSSSCPQPPPQADPNSEEYLRALDEAWEAFEAELDLKFGTGPKININSQYQESLKDDMTDSASPATPTPASTS